MSIKWRGQSVQNYQKKREGEGKEVKRSKYRTRRELKCERAKWRGKEGERDTGGQKKKQHCTWANDKTFPSLFESSRKDGRFYHSRTSLSNVRIPIEAFEKRRKMAAGQSSISATIDVIDGFLYFRISENNTSMKENAWQRHTWSECRWMLDVLSTIERRTNENRVHRGRTVLQFIFESMERKTSHSFGSCSDTSFTMNFHFRTSVNHRMIRILEPVQLCCSLSTEFLRRNLALWWTHQIKDTSTQCLKFRTWINSDTAASHAEKHVDVLLIPQLFSPRYLSQEKERVKETERRLWLFGRH